MLVMESSSPGELRSLFGKGSGVDRGFSITWLLGRQIEIRVGFGSAVFQEFLKL